MERTSYAVHVQFNTEFMILKASTKAEAAEFIKKRMGGR